MYSDSELLETARQTGLVAPDATDLPRTLRSKAAATRQALDAEQSRPTSGDGDDLVVHVAITRGDREIHSTSFTIPTENHT